MENNRQVYIVPEKAVISDILESAWLRDYVGRVSNINGNDLYIVTGSIPRSSNMSKASMLGRSYNGRLNGSPVSHDEDEE